MRRLIVLALLTTACGGTEELELAEDESEIFDAEHGLIERVTAIAPGVLAPRPGLGVFVEVTREDGTRDDMRVETDEAGAVAIVSQEASAAASPPRACEDRARNLAPWTWASRFEWWFDASTRPRGMDAARAENALKAAATNITRSDNDCGLADRVSAAHLYRGRTSRRPAIDAAGRCGEPDGVNVLAFGDLPQGTLAVTCTWYALDGTAVESDIEMNKVDHAWTLDLTSSCSNRFHLEAVMTHEFGHVFGLLHVAESAHGRLTMSPRAAPCQRSEATLGRGDIIGLRRKYPSSP